MMFLVVPAAFLVAISILVAVHEFGHYWVAKKLGFKVLPVYNALRSSIEWFIANGYAPKP